MGSDGWLNNERLSSDGAAAAATARDRRRAVTEAFIVGLVVLGVVGAAIGGIWTTTTNSLQEEYGGQLIALAQVAAQQVDPSLHAGIRRTEQRYGVAYRRAVEPLRRMRAGVPAIRFIYTIVRDGDDVRFVLDASDTPGDDRDGARAALWSLNHSNETAKFTALGWDGKAGRAVATNRPYPDRAGVLMTGYAPFFDSMGRQQGAVGVDIDASSYVAHLEEARAHLLAGLVPAGLLTLVLTIGVFRLRMRALTATRDVEFAAEAARVASRHDGLTGLPNRISFIERLHVAVERVHTGRQPSLAVLFLDFDHFKFVNDTLGHDAGDDLLRQIAGRLRAVLGLDAPGADEDTNAPVIARFGGDEFVALLNDLPGGGDARATAERLLRGLGDVYTLKGIDVHSTASIGLARSGDPGDDAEALVRHADVAMYEAKKSGRGCCVEFDEAMRARITRRLLLESSLMTAIGTPQVTLAYQPIVELESGRMVAVEALLRWQHPQLGEIEPAEFVPLAEENGLIVPLGEWVMREACRQLADWQRQDPARAPDAVSVNLSRAELALGARLVERVRGSLQDSGLAPRALQIEISEREVVRNSVAVVTMMEGLRALGVRLSMDEFGTGSSSLSCLRGFPFDMVKIDRSFARGLASNSDVMALIHATLTLVENLGMASVAEGIEDTAQLAILQSLGCKYAQGRLFSQPLAAAALLDGWDASRRHDAAGKFLHPPAASAA